MFVIKMVMAFFTDLLKTDNRKFSQARVYLFASVAVYFLTIVIYLSHAFFGIVSDVNVLMNIMNSLQYMMLIFASYSLVGKGLSREVIKERLDMHSKFTPPPMTPISDGRNITPMAPPYQRGDPEYVDYYKGGDEKNGPDQQTYYDRYNRSRPVVNPPQRSGNRPSASSHKRGDADQELS
jgi:hypothetical protein